MTKMTDVNANAGIAKGLMAEKLDGYLPEGGVEDQPKAVLRGRLAADALGRAARVRADRVPPMAQAKPPLDRREWAEKMVPAVVTPHVLSKAKADATLVGVRERVRFDVLGQAHYGQGDWDLMVKEVVGMMLDCAEGAGLVVKDAEVSSRMRVVVSGLLWEHTKFLGDDGYAKIAIDLEM